MGGALHRAGDLQGEPHVAALIHENASSVAGGEQAATALTTAMVKMAPEDSKPQPNSRIWSKISTLPGQLISRLPARTRR